MISYVKYCKNIYRNKILKQGKYPFMKTFVRSTKELLLLQK